MEEICCNPIRNCNGCEMKSPLFCLLTDGELQMVDKNKLTVEFREGETIRKQGTFMSHVISLNAGLAKLYLEGGHKTSAILRIVKPTHFVGGPGLYLDQIHHFTVTALNDCVVCFIDLKVFKEIVDRNKAFRDALFEDFSRNMLAVYNRLLLLVQKQMPGRMADTLLYLFDDVYGSDQIPLHLSKQDLADLSGMSKESAIKVLREFQNEHIITIPAGKMILENRETLQRISKTG